MSAVRKVYTITEKLYEIVSQPIVKEQRDEQIERITFLLDERERLLPNVYSPFSEDEKALFQQIIEWNLVITSKFTHIKKQVQQDLVHLKKSKSSNQHYINPYQSVSTSDGRFYDKRK